MPIVVVALKNQDHTADDVDKRRRVEEQGQEADAEWCIARSGHSGDQITAPITQACLVLALIVSWANVPATSVLRLERTTGIEPATFTLAR